MMRRKHEAEEGPLAPRSTLSSLASPDAARRLARRHAMEWEDLIVAGVDPIAISTCQQLHKRQVAEAMLALRAEYERQKFVRRVVP
jgi:hypothetical protein